MMCDASWVRNMCEFDVYPRGKRSQRGDELGVPERGRDEKQTASRKPEVGSR